MKIMRAAAIDRFGPPSVFKIREIPAPAIGADEVLIRIDTAGVGVWDAHARRGDWGKKEFPLILGVDGSGVIAEAGRKVGRFKKGDRVYAYSYDNPKGGFYAEYVAVAANNVARVPKTLDMVAAGGLATIGLTALQGVDDALKIRRGERVIIHGASGNVGMIALQFAKLRGARVLAIASGKDGVKLVRRLGADEAIDGKRVDVRAAAREFEPDAVLAFVGGPDLTRCIDALGTGGRVAHPNGVEPAPRKRKGIKLKAYDAVPGVREFQRLERAIEEAKLEVPIAGKFKLDKAADAHRLVEKGHLVGKVVLLP